MIKIRQQVLYYAICKPGNIIKEFGLFFDLVSSASIQIKSKTKGNENKEWIMQVNCNVNHIN